MQQRLQLVSSHFGLPLDEVEARRLHPRVTKVRWFALFVQVDAADGRHNVRLLARLRLLNNLLKRRLCGERMWLYYWLREELFVHFVFYFWRRFRRRLRLFLNARINFFVFIFI